MTTTKKASDLQHDLIEGKSELSQLFALTKIIKLRWKWLVYRVDFAAGLKLPPRIAGMQSKIQQCTNYPDLFFPKPIGKYHGLYIEFKTDEGEVYNKDGSMVANSHIRGQWQVLQMLSGLGYRAVFGFGVDHSLEIIENYLSGN